MEKRKYINSCTNYTGNKFKLLYQLLPEFDYNRSTFVDLFCGGGSVFTNVVDKYEYIIANDIIEDLIGIHKELIFNNDEFINKVKLLSPNKDNQEEYVNLRKSYNEYKSPEKLYALMLSCTNNMMRFNKKFEFNQTFGRRTFNENTQKKIIDFVNHIQPYKNKITFTSKNFKDVEIPSNCMIYCDPPYSNSEAGYNCYWNKDDDMKLYNFLINIHKNNNSFMISGVLSHNGQDSEMLKRLISDGFNYKELEFNYNKVSRISDDKKTIEIIVKNY